MGRSEDSIKCAQTKIPIRRSDGRIFMMPVAAAWNLRYEHGVTESVIEVGRSIYYACEGYIKEVYGFTYKWAPEEKWRYTGKSENSPTYHLPRMSEAGKITFEGISQLVILRPDLFIKWTPMCDLEIPLRDVPGYTGSYRASFLARNLNRWQDAYQIILGLEISRRFSERPKQEVMHVMKTSEGTGETLEALYYQYKSATVGERYKAVVETESGTYYESIAEAWHKSKVPSEQIKLCCYGDIPYVRRFGRTFVFKWARDAK